MAIPKTEKGKQTVAIPTPLHRRDLHLVERLHLVPLDLQRCGIVDETGHLRPVGIGVCDWDWDVAGWEMMEGHCGCSRCLLYNGEYAFAVYSALELSKADG